MIDKKAWYNQLSIKAESALFDIEDYECEEFKGVAAR